MKAVIFVCTAVSIQSCATYSTQAFAMRDGLLQGHPELSLAIAEDNDPQQKEVIASLDKGMLRRINNDFSGSNQILEVAKQEIEVLYGISVTENIAAVTINETLRGYEGDRYEQLLLHAYMAMNYIQLDQVEGARVEMLQANVKMMEWGESPEDDAFVRYFEGIIYESMGEKDEALISYRKAYAIYKEKGGDIYPVAPDGLKKDLLRLLSWQQLLNEYKTYKKEFSMANFEPAKVNEDFGELVVILNNGLAPIRSEAAIPIFSSEVQKNLRIAFPVYRLSQKILYDPLINVNGKQYQMETVENIDALARASLENAMPGIMARATARAVIKYNTQQTAQGSSDLAGLLMTITNLVTERADTRSWSTLPQEIALKRILLPVGEHKIQIQMKNAAGHMVDVIDDAVIIKSKQMNFVIKHWNVPLQRIKRTVSKNADDNVISETVQ